MPVAEITASLSKTGVAARSHGHTQRCGVLHADRREDGDLQLLGGEDVGCVTLAAKSSLNYRNVHLQQHQPTVAHDATCMSDRRSLRRH